MIVFLFRCNKPDDFLVSLSEVKYYSFSCKLDKKDNKDYKCRMTFHRKFLSQVNKSIITYGEITQ